MGISMKLVAKIEDIPVTAKKRGKKSDISPLSK